MKTAKWSAGYASDIMEAFQNDIFPYVGTRPICEIKALELLNVLRKIEKTRGVREDAQSTTALFRNVSLCHSYWES